MGLRRKVGVYKGLGGLLSGRSAFQISFNQDTHFETTVIPRYTLPDSTKRFRHTSSCVRHTFIGTSSASPHILDIHNILHIHDVQEGFLRLLQ